MAKQRDCITTYDYLERSRLSLGEACWREEGGENNEDESTRLRQAGMSKEAVVSRVGSQHGQAACRLEDSRFLRVREAETAEGSKPGDEYSILCSPFCIKAICAVFVLKNLGNPACTTILR